jgi:hypothetical protein
LGDTGSGVRAWVGLARTAHPSPGREAATLSRKGRGVVFWPAGPWFATPRQRFRLRQAESAVFQVSETNLLPSPLAGEGGHVSGRVRGPVWTRNSSTRDCEVATRRQSLRHFLGIDVCFDFVKIRALWGEFLGVPGGFQVCVT